LQGKTQNVKLKTASQGLSRIIAHAIAPAVHFIGQGGQNAGAGGGKGMADGDGAPQRVEPLRIDAGRPKSKTISRAMLEMKGSCSTLPLTACEESDNYGMPLKTVPALTKGVRMPPTMATRLVVVMGGSCS
jgi:hypothetical protein